MNIDITQIVVAVIGLLSVIVTSVIVPLLKQKLGAEKMSELQKWVEIAVHAAEQIITGTGKGKEKKEYVIEFLREKGFDVDDQAVENAIEAAVYDMNNAFLTSVLEDSIEIPAEAYVKVEGTTAEEAD